MKMQQFIFFTSSFVRFIIVKYIVLFFSAIMVYKIIVGATLGPIISQKANDNIITEFRFQMNKPIGTWRNCLKVIQLSE